MSSRRTRAGQVRRFHWPAAVCAALALLFVTHLSWSSPASGRAYPHIVPVPGSTMVSPLNNIVLRADRELDPRGVAGARLAVTGAASGSHSGRLLLSDDRRTLVFRPDRPFAPGEAVRVTMARGPLALGGAVLPAIEFQFTVGRTNPAAPQNSLLEDEGGETAEPGSAATAPAPAGVMSDLPAGYPPITLLVSDHPEPGVVFCTPARNTPPVSNTHMMILDNDAMPLFYRKTSSRPVDLRLLPDGRLLYYEIGKRAAYVMDANYVVVDSFKAGNGYSSDSHDTVILPEGHALVMIHDQEPVDMSQVVPGGNPNAIVTGLVIQEIDQAKNVVWQWRSWDHFEITDMSTACANLTDAVVDYVHGNAMEVDFDGNLLVSGRYLNEIFKIDRATGDVMWRFGLNAKRNQFTILNDPLGFSDQHDVRRLPNGHITMFDNHYCIAPKTTRVLEYELDEQTLTATLVWQYDHVPAMQSQSGGGYQRRAGGGGMIGWANCTTPPHMTDLHADGSTAWEVQFWAPPTRSLTYRAYRFPWHSTAFTTDLESIDFGAVAPGDPVQRPLTVTNHTSEPVTFTSFVTRDSAFTVLDAAPITVEAGSSVTLQVQFRPSAIGDVATTLYVRSATTTQLIAQSVALTGRGDIVTPTRLLLFDAEWTEAGVEVRWRLGPDAGAATTRIDRRDDNGDAWTTLADGTREEAGATVLLDRTAVAGHAYRYRLVAADQDGRVVFTEERAVAGAPDRFTISSVSPNPSSAGVTVAFSLPREALVRLAVFDVHGRRVGMLADGRLPAGPYQVKWNAARAGLYLVRYEWPGGSAARRIIVTR